MPLSDLLISHFNSLMEEHWTFLHSKWPEMEPTKFHRTEIKCVSQIDKVKKIVLEKLGAIPVFFFLTVLFQTQHYPGPYRNVEKGLLILYHLLKGCTFSEMAEFIPQSTFHDIHKSFYGRERSLNELLDKQVTYLLANMFSTIKIRIISAKEKNPELFKTVTLLLDGHDTRAKEVGTRSSEAYSYKLKKSGFRTQVCIDMNKMVLFVSESAPCSQNDGVMFTNINLKDKIHESDCIGLDGGYTLFVNQVLKLNDKFQESNFVCPIRKPKNAKLSAEEVEYNKRFGSFRSSIESFFGELGKTFEKLNNGKSIITTNPNVFNLQFKVACLLLNIKTFVKLGVLPVEPIHGLWLENQWDYPAADNTPNTESLSISTLKDAATNSQKMSENQARLLAGVSSYEMDEDEYEFEAIIGHKGIGKNRRYLVKWKGCKETENTWLSKGDFTNEDYIDDYESNLLPKRKRKKIMS
jgi:hypothetical protein